MRSSRKKLLVGATAAVGVLGIGVAAFAYWTTGGAGTGSASTGTNASITVNQDAPTTTLYPGGSIPLTGTYTNLTNPGTVRITTLTATIDNFSVPAIANGNPPCTQADFSLSVATPTTVTITVNTDVPHGTATATWSGITLSMVNAATNQDNCKNITVPITYSAA